MPQLTNQPTKQLTKGGELRKTPVNAPRGSLATPQFDRIAGLSNRHLKIWLGLRLR